MGHGGFPSGMTMQTETPYETAIKREYSEQIVLAAAKDNQGKHNPITLGSAMILFVGRIIAPHVNQDPTGVAGTTWAAARSARHERRDSTSNRLM
jgi:hypothetical protein